jgi:hypothetical protein
MVKAITAMGWPALVTTTPAGGEEGVHELSLPGQIALLRGKLGLLHPTPGPAGQLPGCLWVRPAIAAISWSVLFDPPDRAV